MSRETWQRIQSKLGLVADGIPGPRTAAAVAEALDVAPAPSPALGAFPRDRQADLFDYFGEPGLHQVRLAMPFPLRIDWDLDKTITSFSCHEKVHDSLKRIFERTLAEYGLDRIRELNLDRFGGCLNVRKKRGGSTWSTHAWGAAVDLWPEANALRWDHTRAAFARPAYGPFWEIVESEGWTSLGRARDFDWMHFQAPTLG